MFLAPEPWWDAEGAVELHGEGTVDLHGEPLTPAPPRPQADRGPAAGPGVWTARV
ncbi:hypothetical protein [Streptomyces sp. NPDC053720]|uniref:hypothetical protein n=1 Tax=Streptomyces sp. NPDC053720 TaxID=3154855 RepID=UPI00341BBC5B